MCKSILLNYFCFLPILDQFTMFNYMQVDIRNYIILSLVFSLVGIALGQKNEGEVIKPILVDKSALSGIGLDKIVLKDEPDKDFYQRRIYWGDDIGVFVVSTESWVNRMDNFPFDEYIFMYNGEVEVRPDRGNVQQFYSGDHFWAPKGYTGEWEIKAGDYLHYELSVIATQRADASSIAEYREHVPISKTDISGSLITLDSTGHYNKSLVRGVELEITIKAELPQSLEDFLNEKECLIHLLSGQITIEDPVGEVHTFHAGDFFILREGLKGQWASEGHGLVKYLSIEGVQ